MGLFDRFKKRVKEVAEEVDSEALTATEDSAEGKLALKTSAVHEDEWEDADTEELDQTLPPIEEEKFEDDDWDDEDEDDWDDDDDDWDEDDDAEE